MVRTLIVTNDLPPRRGGIQTFVHEILRSLDPDSFAVFGPAESGSAAFDASAGYEVHRYSGSVIPTPRVAKAVAEVAAATGAGQIMLGSGMPNAYLIPLLRRHDLPTALVITHGNEAGWAQLPGGRTLVQPLNGARAVTYLGDFTYRILSRYIQPATKLHRLSPGVDTDRFSPSSGGADFRRRHNLSDAFVIGTLTRLVPRKGVALLIRALPYVRRAVPDAHVLVAGDGPHRRELEDLARQLSVDDRVVFAGSVPESELPAAYDAMDVFALPTHTRRWGVDVEGLGIVFLEASAAGVPILVGDSGGSVDAVQDGVTGNLIGTNPEAIAAEIVELARDEAQRREMGARGRQWMVDEWQWADRATSVSGILGGD